MAITLWRNARLASLTAGSPWGWFDRGALLVDGDTLAWVGNDSQIPDNEATRIFDLAGALVTPGLIDCHTHLVYGGHRAAEFEQRLQGISYEEIARRGGGIRSTVAATRTASNDSLFAAAQKRCQLLMSEGITTIEIKSGYGLSLDDEARCLRVARMLANEDLTVRTTYLGAHTVPPEYDGKADEYINSVCDWMPVLAREGLVDAVDAFCDCIGFTIGQTRRVFESAKRLNLPVKLHAEQLSDQGGAILATEFDALSCDHVEYLSQGAVEAMAKTGTVAVLLPGAYYFLRETQKPPIDALRKAGVPIAVATDHNPGSSPVLSLLLMLNMACTFFRLTPEEAFRGVTVNAAKALGLKDRGQLVAGQRADFAVWNAEHPNELCYWFGRNPLQCVVVGGRVR